jgi:hypothetical protein
MTRLTKSISLVLIGSSLLLAGCSSRTDEEDREDGQGATGSGTGTHYHGHGGGYHPWIWYHGGSAYRGPAGSPARPGSHAGAVQHGGFGASGHAAAGS